MKLLKMEYFNLVIEPEALLVKSIRNLWNRDKSKTKTRAFSELGYIFFFIDPRSTYSYITDLEERSNLIIKEEGLPTNWKPDKIVQEAMESYKKSVVTTSSLLLEDTKFAVDNLRKYLRAMDFTETDDKGKPKYPVNTLATAVNQVADLAEKLMRAEKIVEQELLEKGNMRGQRDKKILEDGMIM